MPPAVLCGRHVGFDQFTAPPMAGNFTSIKPGRLKLPALDAAKSAKSSYRLLRNGCPDGPHSENVMLRPRRAAAYHAVLPADMQKTQTRLTH